MRHCRQVAEHGHETPPRERTSRVMTVVGPPPSTPTHADPAQRGPDLAAGPRRRAAPCVAPSTSIEPLCAAPSMLCRIHTRWHQTWPRAPRRRRTSPLPPQEYRSPLRSCAVGSGRREKSTTAAFLAVTRASQLPARAAARQERAGEMLAARVGCRPCRLEKDALISCSTLLYSSMSQAKGAFHSCS
jgi:hypothetical protein